MRRRLRRLLLWLAMGPRDFSYMAMTLRQDPRLRRCKLADIVVRQDGYERRIEADWLKRLARIVYGDGPIAKPPILPAGEEALRAEIAKLKGLP